MPTSIPSRGQRPVRIGYPLWEDVLPTGQGYTLKFPTLFGPQIGLLYCMSGTESVAIVGFGGLILEARGH